MERHRSALRWVSDDLDYYLANLDTLDDETVRVVFEAARLRDAAREQPAFDRLIDDSAFEQSIMNSIIMLNRLPD